MIVREAGPHLRGTSLEPAREEIDLEPQRRRIDIVSDPGFLEDLGALTTDEVRSRRAMCQELDRELSYYRRMLHGRLDLLAFERRRRRGEEDRTLIDALPDILGDPGEADSHATVTTAEVAPPHIPVPGRRSIDFALGDDFLARIGEMDDATLDEIEAALTEAERAVSSDRRTVHQAADALGAEIARRYRAGLTSVDELFRG